eukprot:TRINITY_DN49471_c0_g1_i1.p1 TRINITY_DN49471_c0_g1~~TRINITY_DN49471_c0_g1_i1.p1  ORF type:complete len:384 (+),score=75.94 TRINITY_DN49471_c0_g1_i1:74-1225(+)
MVARRASLSLKCVAAAVLLYCTSGGVRGDVTFLAPAAGVTRTGRQKLGLTWARASASPAAVFGASEPRIGTILVASALASMAFIRTKRRPCVHRNAVGSMELDTSGPLAYVKLTQGADEATVYLRGASVASYKTAGVEWLGLRADVKLDGTKPNISGGIPICFPQFGPGDPLGRDVTNPETAHIPVHGLARNMDWRLLESSSQGSACVLELQDTEETRKVWPHSFRCLYHVELKEGELATKLTVENTSTSECSFTCGVHTYYDVSDIDAMRIAGDFKGSTKLNRSVDPAEPTSYEKDDIVIREFTDDIYKGVLPGTVVVHDDKGELAIVSGGGWQHVVVWNPYGDEKLGFRKFVCVESVATDAITLAPEATWEASMNLVPKMK